MPNLSSLTPLQTKATALANLVLVSPQSVIGYQPQNPPNADGTQSTEKPPAALLFHYEGENTATVTSDITDHYIEDNTAVQDQIALKPEIVTVHGFIGELNDVTPSFLTPLKFIADKLTTVGAYTPGLSVTALVAYNTAFLAYQLASNLANSAVSAWDSLTGQGGESVINGQGITQESNQNKQQAMFQQFYGYWRRRTLFTVQTPWAVFQDMAIQSLRAVQEADTNVITDFEVTFKMIRKTSTISVNGVAVDFQGRGRTQASDETDLGTSSPQPSIGLGTGLANAGMVA